MTTNTRYNGIKTETLIKWIQETRIKAMDPKWKKKIGTSAYLRTLREINWMGAALIKRLNDMDRMNPKFFPVGTYVVYENTNYPVPPKNGQVVEHLADTCIVKFEGETYPVQVHPCYLSIAFIKPQY